MSMDRSNKVPVRPWQSTASVPTIWSDLPWSYDAKEENKDTWQLSRKSSLHSDYDPTLCARSSPPADLQHPSRRVQHLRALDTPRHSAPQTFLEATIAKLGADARESISEPANGTINELKTRPRTVSAASTWQTGPDVDDTAMNTRRWLSLSGQGREPSFRTDSLGSYDLTKFSTSPAHGGRLSSPLKYAAMDPSGVFSQMKLHDAHAPPQSPTSLDRPWSATVADLYEDLAPDAHNVSSSGPPDAIPYVAPMPMTSMASVRAPIPTESFMTPSSMPVEAPLWTPPHSYSAPYGQPNLVLPVPFPQRAFVIKSFTEVDIQRSVHHGVWTSTEKGNKRLDSAWRQSHATGPIYLFFSVNGSGRFCGVAQMTSGLDYTQSSDIWADGTRWKGLFHVHWLLIKDVPNAQLRHIYLRNTADVRPVTKSRDTQELLPEAAAAVLQIFFIYTGYSSLLTRETSPMSR